MTCGGDNSKVSGEKLLLLANFLVGLPICVFAELNAGSIVCYCLYSWAILAELNAGSFGEFTLKYYFLGLIWEGGKAGSKGRAISTGDFLN